MDKTAIQAARDSMGRAEAAVHNIEHADSFEELEAAWSDFLVMANRVYTKLEQGSKVNPKSITWFGLKKYERRKDQLLKYIKNARDADEHGLKRVTEREPGRTLIASGLIEAVDGHTIRLTPESMRQPKITVGTSPARVVLVEVTNYGDKYQPPNDTSPLSVAQKAILHLRSLIAEAEGLS